MRSWQTTDGSFYLLGADAHTENDVKIRFVSPDLSSPVSGKSFVKYLIRSFLLHI